MIVIISFCVVSALILNTEFHFLRNQLKKYASSPNPDEDEFEPEENVEIEFESENKSDYLQLPLQQIILIKSANNYIEVIYNQENKTRKKLIRNTLKNTEKQFAKYPSMLRCHRSYIVNKNYIQKVKKGSDGLILVLFDYPQEIHVSRQYILVVKEALKAT
jgi:DNA-binding LytR/AlgR family response regulator